MVAEPLAATGSGRKAARRPEDRTRGTFDNLGGHAAPIRHQGLARPAAGQRFGLDLARATLDLAAAPVDQLARFLVAHRRVAAGLGVEDQHAVFGVGLEGSIGDVVIRIMHRDRFHPPIVELHRAVEQQLELRTHDGSAAEHPFPGSRTCIASGPSAPPSRHILNW